MEAIDNKAIQSALAGFLPAEPRSSPDDWQDHEGLTHCGTCGGQKEAIIKFAGRITKVPCICKCRAAELKAQDAARELREKVARLRTAGFPDTEQKRMTFENALEEFKTRKVYEAARRFVDNFDYFKASGKGILFWGPTSTGKTYAAACIVNALITEQGRAAMITNFERIFNELDGLKSGRQEYIDAFNQFELLAIDDLGAERQTEAKRAIVYSIIDARSKIKKPLILTTNMDLKEISSPTDIENGRIYERILALCHPVKVDGASIRRQLLKDTYQDINKLLGL